MISRRLFAKSVATLPILTAAYRGAEARSASDVPLPADLEIIRPYASVPSDMARFSGTWRGMWDGVLDHVLAVERDTPPSGVIVYAWGRAPRWKIERGGWFRLNARIGPRTLETTLPSGALVVYTMDSPRRLTAIYREGKVVSHALLTKE